MVVIRVLALPLSAIALASCLGATDPARDQRSYGFILMDAVSSAGGYVGKIQATFFRGPTLQLPSVVPPRDLCSLFPYQPGDEQSNLPASTLAGDAIDVRLSGSEFSLFPQTSDGLLRYYPPELEFVPYQPGDTMYVTVPGSATFPAWSLSGRTAEPFTFESVDESSTVEPLELRWTPPTSPNSKMLVSLRYSTTSLPNQLSEQIFCELLDDGQFDIPAEVTTWWRSAPGGLREVQFARWRVTIDEDGNDTMLIVSTFLFPTPTPEQETE